MAVDPELLELMPFTATLKPPVSRNLYAEVTYGAALSPAPHCAVQFTGKRVLDAKGMVRTEAGICILESAYPVETDWYLGIPTPSGIRSVTIFSVETASDETGWHHTTISFGS
jgi:hypothetical protein